jgi:hypothetical protein
LALAFLASFAVLAFGFKSAVAVDAAEPEPLGLPVTAPRAYDQKSLAADMKALKARLSRLRQIDETIVYEGRDSRLIKHYLKLLAPNACQEFTAIEIRSPRTADGFSAKGLCLFGRPEANLQVHWNSDQALISIEGQSQVLTLPLNGQDA